ncbi:MAG: hypothetical protein ACLRXC_13210 [[Clostridium] leptum]
MEPMETGHIGGLKRGANFAGAAAFILAEEALFAAGKPRKN